MGQSHVRQIKFLLRKKDNPVTGSRRILIIYNPVAGQNHGRRFEKILRLLENAGIAVEICETKYPDHAIELAAANKLRDNIEAIVAAGGDGTLGEVAQGLRHAPMPLGFIPLGTANVFAFEIGIGTNAVKIAKTLIEKRKIEIWPGLMDGRRFLLMVGCGYDSVAVAGLDPKEKQKWGAAAYVFSAWRQRKIFRDTRAQVSWETQSEEAASIVIARARKYGGPFTVFPKASLTEKRFQVLMLSGGGLWNAVLYGLFLAINKLHLLASVSVYETSSPITVVNGQELNFQMDGDLKIRAETKLEIESEPLNILVPKGYR